jgi:hypothetical protein
VRGAAPRSAPCAAPRCRSARGCGRGWAHPRATRIAGNLRLAARQAGRADGPGPGRLERRSRGRAGAEPRGAGRRAPPRSPSPRAVRVARGGGSGLVAVTWRDRDSAASIGAQTGPAARVQWGGGPAGSARARIRE